MSIQNILVCAYLKKSEVKDQIIMIICNYREVLDKRIQREGQILCKKKVFGMVATAGSMSACAVT